jgi:hypothetical protein
MVIKITNQKYDYSILDQYRYIEIDENFRILPKELVVKPLTYKNNFGLISNILNPLSIKNGTKLYYDNRPFYINCKKILFDNALERDKLLMLHDFIWREKYVGINTKLKRIETKKETEIKNIKLYKINQHDIILEFIDAENIFILIKKDLL